MSNAAYIYRFLSMVWDEFPNKERERFAELWRGYEQVHSDVYSELTELGLAGNIDNIPAYGITRWNKYTFKDLINEPATFTSFSFVLKNLDLSQQYMLRIRVDGTPYDIDTRGATPTSTSIEEMILNINNTVGFRFASPTYDNTSIKLTTKSSGPTSSIVIEKPTHNDGTYEVLGVSPYQVPLKVPQYKYQFPFDNNVHKVPSFQNSIKNSALTHFYVDEVDFHIYRNTSRIGFREMPLESLWARDSYVNTELPYYNFGYLVDYRNLDREPQDYLEIVQAIWFAYWHGPRPLFIRQTICLILGLPTAVNKGLVNRIERDTLEIIHIDGTLKAYVLPPNLKWLVGIGDYVDRFQPLCDGVEVYDKVSLPGFIKTEVGYGGQLDPFALDSASRGPGDTDETKALAMLEEHTYLPQVNVNAFVRPKTDLRTIFSFLRALQPLHKTFQFQISVVTFDNDIVLGEKLSWDYAIDVTPNVDYNQDNSATYAVRDDYELFPNNALDLDSDTFSMSEQGEIRASDITGSLPQYDVNF